VLSRQRASVPAENWLLKQAITVQLRSSPVLAYTHIFVQRLELQLMR